MSTTPTSAPADGTRTSTVLRAEGFTCPSCVATIRRRVGRLAGVHGVEVRFASGRVEVEHDPAVISAEQLASAVTELGYPATPAAF